jgi:1-deoxy-D-xylulose-5-phosphate synthase
MTLWRRPPSTSISALGMAIASNLKGDFDKQHIAVMEMLDSLWDGFEGLNHAGVTANLLCNSKRQRYRD